jgi:uncharacterized protein (DUF302 family)
LEESFAYKLQSNKPFEAVVKALEDSIARNQFRVLAIHNVRETLAEKGFEYGDLKIIELCNAGFAHRALSTDADVALFMPCRYTVRVEDGRTVVSLNRPTMIARIMPDSGLEELAASVEETMKKIMQESV